MFDIPEMVPLHEFAPEIMISTEGAPQDMVENYILHAAIDFAMRSQVLIRDVALDLQGGVEEYPVRVDERERVVSLQYMGRKRGACDCPYRAICGVPLKCGAVAQFVSPDRVVVTPAPKSDQEQGLWVRVAVTPARDACEVDRRLYDDYHEGIVSGALARLLLLKGMPWYDAALSTFHRKLADNATTAAGIDRLTAGRRGPFRMNVRRIV